jgi:hypothetical protein
MLGPVHAQVSRRVKVSVSNRGFPTLTGRSGTPSVGTLSAVAHDARRPGSRRHPASYALGACSGALLAGSSSALASGS